MRLTTTETANHEKSDAKATHPEAGKAEPTVSTEIKDKALETATKPAEAVSVAASSRKISHVFPSRPAHVPVEEDYWDGEPEGSLVIWLFWTILYKNWASLSEFVRAPALSGSIRSMCDF
ncbi:hypothetical protein PGTUg99_028763 [Puccinia graminis f. sp. tritici]|uniref:Uncharacterized protein n=1 Tax=Puccinia graminis f. sp. tritici TaxID=56615 RepID=A0A5B0REQ2_PUCGR|nr:hypothetical protein PGTUg99_028763 [Puccinia graminis f. sp. tritici]